MSLGGLGTGEVRRPLSVVVTLARKLAPVVIGLLVVGAPPSGAEDLRTRNVVLVTADGLRHEELFTGADPVLLESGEKAGIVNLERLRDRYWRATAEERREALLPFLWKEIAPRALVLGDRSAGSVVTVMNPHHVSYPGYAELLTGRVVPEITGNIDLQNPVETILEIARRKLGLDRTGVGAFTSWQHFPYIVEHRPGSIFVNAGEARVDAGVADDAMRFWSELQFRLPSPWDEVRYNAFTEELALAFLEEHHPRLLFVSFDETDEWAHGRRYDRTLDAIHLFDAALERIWKKIQSLDGYRDRTSLVVTTDHGRGKSPDDWTSHGDDVPGSEETWIVVLGPDTDPFRGRRDEPVSTAQVAPTVLALLGIEPTALGPGAASVLPHAIRKDR